MAADVPFGMEHQAAAAYTYEHSVLVGDSARRRIEWNCHGDNLS